MADEFVIDGMRELALALDQFPQKLQDRALDKVMRRGGRLVANIAKNLVPVKSGALRKSIRVTIVRDRSSGLVTARIIAGKRGPGDYDHGYYALFVERGTQPHEERPKNKKSLFLAGVFSEVVEHPGAEAHPYLEPALEGGAQPALDAMAEELGAQIEQLADSAP
jgi:HK97 gp10 family phage protein